MGNANTPGIVRELEGANLISQTEANHSVAVVSYWLQLRGNCNDPGIESFKNICGKRIRKVWDKFRKLSRLCVEIDRDIHRYVDHLFIHRTEVLTKIPLSSGGRERIAED